MEDCLRSTRAKHDTRTPSVWCFIAPSCLPPKVVWFRVAYFKCTHCKCGICKKNIEKKKKLIQHQMGEKWIYLTVSLFFTKAKNIWLWVCDCSRSMQLIHGLHLQLSVPNVFGFYLKIWSFWRFKLLILVLLVPLFVRFDFTGLVRLLIWILQDLFRLVWYNKIWNSTIHIKWRIERDHQMR